MVTFCPKCGTQAVDDQSLFCNTCGTPLPGDIPEEPGNYCPNCRTNNLDIKTGSCSRCGFLVSPKRPADRPVPPSKTCPQCGEPVIGESRYYCKACGAYIRDKQARDASMADDTSGSKTSVKKPVIIPGIYQDAGTRTIIRPEKSERTEPFRITRAIDLSSPSARKGAVILLILGGAALILWAGMTLMGSAPGLPQPGDVLVTQDLSSLSLTSDDLPEGWVTGESGGTADAYSAQFFTGSENSDALVEQMITRYPGIEEAKLEFTTERDQVTGITPDTLDIGDESFGYIDVNYVVVLFRRGNVIVKIEDTRTEYQDNPTISNAKQYAEIVAQRFR